MHQLEHIRIRTSFQTDNNVSTLSFNFCQDRCSFWRPINSVSVTTMDTKRAELTYKQTIYRVHVNDWVLHWRRRAAVKYRTTFTSMLFFTARCYASAVLATALCPSVCPSQVGVLLKRLNVGSHKQHRTIAKGL